MSSPFFCQIAAAFFVGLTNGTSATTFSPLDLSPREQMAAFVTRTMDQGIKRGSRRSALDQYWIPRTANDIGVTQVGNQPQLVAADGTDLWVTNFTSGTVSRVRASDGRLLETWTGATEAMGIAIGRGRVFVAGGTKPGALYQIDPKQPAGAVTLLTSSLGLSSLGIAFDGQRIWTANSSTVSIVNLNPVGVTNVAGFGVTSGLIFDGSNIWVTDNVSGSVDKLHKLDSNGSILMSANVGSFPFLPVFDGTNIWVPNASGNTITVVRAIGGLAGTVLATLSGNGLSGPLQAAFDGERILVSNSNGQSVSLWKATDFSPLGSSPVGAEPVGACSDGINFWITLPFTNRLARF
jgi:hypothetical protein